MQTKNCINCGKEIPKNKRICPYCKTKQSMNDSNLGNQPTNQTQEGQKHPKKQPYTPNEKHTALIIWGWLFNILSLFIPFISIISLILGIRAYKYPAHHRTATLLIIGSIILIVLEIFGTIYNSMHIQGLIQLIKK